MDRLGAGERPGGFARNHRKVRRQEELIWLSVHGFTHIVSLLDSPHNLHAYGQKPAWRRCTCRSGCATGSFRG